MTNEPAVMEAAAPAEAKPDSKRRPKKQPPYHVVLWNDDDHTFEYVIKMLQALFGHPPEKGYQLAKEVHLQGRVTVLTTAREHAELKRDQVLAYGKDDRVRNCKGSMSCTIEPAQA